MLVSVMAKCPGCVHQICEACPVERITMMSRRGKSSRTELKEQSEMVLETLEADLEVDLEEETTQSAEQEADSQLESEIQEEELNHVFEPTTISELASAIELDVESHIPSFTR